MTVASAGKQRQTIRPRPAVTSTVPEVSSVVDAGAFHGPDVCEPAGMSWVFLCTRERIQPRGPRGSSLRNLIDRLPPDPRGGRRKLGIAPDGREQAKRHQQRRLHPKCAPRVPHGWSARREAAGARHQIQLARNSYTLTVALPGRKTKQGSCRSGECWRVTDCRSRHSCCRGRVPVHRAESARMESTCRRAHEPAVR